MHTLKVKNLVLPSNLVQGPLAGYSCAPFRVLAHEYGEPGFCTTEMLSAKNLINLPRKKQHRFIYKDPREGLLCFQLASNNPTELAEAVKISTELGADLIDLNCGCPVSKMRSKGVGSKLLSEPLLLSKLIQTMRENTHLPISIKIRVDGQSQDKNNQALVKIINESGLDFITVHGRHWTDDYSVNCHTEQIAFFANELSIPVIGNGDAAHTDAVKNLLNSGCAGIMISRAGVGQPWLFKQIQTELNGASFAPPDITRKGEMLLRHVAELTELIASETLAVLQARKFSKYYARDQIWRNKFHQEIIECNTLLEMEKIVNNYFV